MLVRSALSAQELQGQWSEYEVLELSAGTEPENSLPYGYFFVEFNFLENGVPGTGYFVIGNTYDAVTQMDLRGH